MSLPKYKTSIYRPPFNADKADPGCALVIGWTGIIDQTTWCKWNISLPNSLLNYSDKGTDIWRHKGKI